MINENQIVQIKWINRTRKYYESRGYKYTGLNNLFDVKVSDLMENSATKVSATCDCCGKSQLTPYRNYIAIIKKRGIYLCKECVHKENIEIRTENSNERLYELFLQECVNHDCIPITSREEFTGIYSEIIYICPKHGIVNMSMRNVPNGAWCIKCGKESAANKSRLTAKSVKQRVESKNNNVLMNADEYINVNTQNLRIICGSCGNEFVTSLASIEAGDGRCLKCGQNEFKKHIQNDKSVYFNNYKKMCSEMGYELISTLDDYQDSSSKLRFICPVHGEQSVSYRKFLSGQRCPKCGIEKRSNSSKLTAEEVKNRIESINNNTLLNPDEYICNNEKNLRILCSCGNEFTTSLVIYELGRNRCSRCVKSESSGELLVKNVLDKYKIDYIQQKTYDDCRDIRPLPFDFFLPEHNTIIEFDGPGHFEPVFGEKALFYTQKHDIIKNNYCKDNGIRIIRIPYWESNRIEEILGEKIGFSIYKLIKYPIN